MRFWFAAGALSAFLIALVALAPAALVDTALARASAGHARIAETRGSVWSGSGQLQLRDAKAGVLISDEITWSVRASALLMGRLVADVRLGREAPPFVIALSAEGVSVTDADLRLPAAALSAIPKLAPLQLTGDLIVRVPRFVFNGGTSHGSATVRWRAAGSALTPVTPLGDYELSLEAAAPGMRGSLRTLEGPLVLEGSGTWAPGARAHVVATGKVAPEREAELAPFLRMIAVERDKGVFELQIQ